MSISASLSLAFVVRCCLLLCLLCSPLLPACSGALPPFAPATRLAPACATNAARSARLHKEERGLTRLPLSVAALLSACALLLLLPPSSSRVSLARLFLSSSSRCVCLCSSSPSARWSLPPSVRLDACRRATRSEKQRREENEGKGGARSSRRAMRGPTSHADPFPSLLACANVSLGHDHLPGSLPRPVPH